MVVGDQKSVNRGYVRLMFLLIMISMPYLSLAGDCRRIAPCTKSVTGAVNQVSVSTVMWDYEKLWKFIAGCNFLLGSESCRD